MDTISLPPMRIVEEAFNDIVNHIGSRPAESGGALFGSEDDYVITRFVPDEMAKTTSSTYTINAPALNRVIERLWHQERLSLIGIVHSHPQGYPSLSGPDMEYFGNLLRRTLNRRLFYAPVVHTVPDGGFHLIPHVIDSNGQRLGRTSIEITPAVQQENRRIPALITHTAKPMQRFTLPRLNVSQMRRALVCQSIALAMLGLGLIGWLLVAAWPHLVNLVIQQLR